MGENNGSKLLYGFKKFRALFNFEIQLFSNEIFKSILKLLNRDF